MVVKSSATIDPSSSTVKLNIIYYPIHTPYLRKKIQPTHSLRRLLLNKVYGADFKKGGRFLSKSWDALNIFSLHRKSARRKKRLKEWMVKANILKARFRGTGFKRYNKRFPSKEFMNAYTDSVNTKLVNRRLFKNLPSTLLWRQPNTLKPWNKKHKGIAVLWEKVGSTLNGRRFSKQLSKRVGYRVNVALINAFTYIQQHFKPNAKSETDFYFNKKYNYFSRRFDSFYDVVSVFYILSYIPKAERLFINMLQYSMSNMHKKGLRPKHFFYFLAGVADSMKQVRGAFKSFKFVITGKLGGGTGRTKVLSLGFGSLPKQTLSTNLRYAFGDLHSKYGAFGLRLFTWRRNAKSKHFVYKLKPRSAKQMLIRRQAGRVLKGLKAGRLRSFRLKTRLKAVQKDGDSKTVQMLKHFQLSQDKRIRKALKRSIVFKKAQKRNSRITKAQAMRAFRGRFKLRVVRKRRILSYFNKLSLLREHRRRRYINKNRRRFLSKQYVYNWRFFKRSYNTHKRIARRQRFRWGSRNIKLSYIGVTNRLRRYALHRSQKARQIKWSWLTKKKDMEKKRWWKPWFTPRHKNRYHQSFHNIKHNSNAPVLLKKPVVIGSKDFSSRGQALIMNAKEIDGFKELAHEYMRKTWRWRRLNPIRSKARGFIKLARIRRNNRPNNWLINKTGAYFSLLTFFAKTHRRKRYGKNISKKIREAKNFRSYFAGKIANKFKLNKKAVKLRSNVPLKVLDKVLQPQLMLKHHVDRALVIKGFGFTSRVVQPIIQSRSHKGLYTNLSYVAIQRFNKKISRRFKRRKNKSYFRQKLNEYGERTKNMFLGKVLSKAAFIRERLILQGHRKRFDRDVRSHVWPAIVVPKKSNNVTAPLADKANKGYLKFIGQLALARSLNKKLFRGPFNHRMKRNYWVKRFYEKSDYKFAIPRSKRRVKDALVTNTKFLDREAESASSNVLRASWVRKLANININLNQEYKKRGIIVGEVSHSNRLALFKKQVLDKTLGITDNSGKLKHKRHSRFIKR